MLQYQAIHKEITVLEFNKSSIKETESIITYQIL